MDIGGDIPVKKKGFFEYVFNFDTETKSNLLNVVQYIILIFVPLASLDYLMKRAFPPAKKGKGTLELLGEILGQTVLTIILVVFVHRVVTYIPTFSGSPIGNLNLWTLSAGFILAVFAVENQVSQKVNMLLSRLGDAWDGKTKGRAGGASKDTPVVKVTQPLSHNARNGVPTHQASRADYLHTHQHVTPPQQMRAPAQAPQSHQPPARPPQEPQAPTEQGIYGGPPTPMVNALTPGAHLQEPLAANEVLGGNFSAW
jgi:hypothetical protein